MRGHVKKMWIEVAEFPGVESPRKYGRSDLSLFREGFAFFG